MLQSVEPLSNQSISSPSPRKLWLAAIKPPMYSVSIIPITTGTAVAFGETGKINWVVFITFLLSAILLLVWENLCNDVFDSETGIDKNKAHSLVNLTGKKNVIFAIGTICLLLGIGGVLGISLWQQDGSILILIALCCILGYSYQGPPFRFGYQGWGEAICFFCFGPLAVSAAYYSQTQTWSVRALVASIVVGVATSLILFCSHFHQVADDIAAGKRSPIVRLGTGNSAKLLPWVCASIYVTTLICIGLGAFPIWTALVITSLPATWKLCTLVNEYHDYPERVQNCKFIAVGLHFWSGICLGLGFIL
ncbi:2-carboxy-1,4-naphthoquinone phytyltransferase [Tumidithrix elongata RA019]|uniref:2-carboxy-1,4-naphthoquinone phytyltransferase n=1 Tax=Tumidithrix elongata BACA0141 TaxID=2716417 RepID=A0AAW9PY25_9CYAN|nr:2-carboxy-1,4-naphthoquinone phytyltransferase [Tumidithrix elongata RA019]